VRSKFGGATEKDKFHEKVYHRVEDGLKWEYQDVINNLTKSQEENNNKTEAGTSIDSNEDIRRRLAEITIDLWQLETFALQSLIDYDDHTPPCDPKTSKKLSTTSAQLN